MPDVIKNIDIVLQTNEQEKKKIKQNINFFLSHLEKKELRILENLAQSMAANYGRKPRRRYNVQAVVSR